MAASEFPTHVVIALRNADGQSQEETLRGVAGAIRKDKKYLAGASSPRQPASPHLACAASGPPASLPPTRRAHTPPFSPSLDLRADLTQFDVPVLQVGTLETLMVRRL